CPVHSLALCPLLARIFSLSLSLPPRPSPSLFFNDPPTTEIYTLSLHDALPIWRPLPDLVTALLHASGRVNGCMDTEDSVLYWLRSEEHTSELQSLTNLVCRLLLEKKKNKRKKQHPDQYPQKEHLRL